MKKILYNRIYLHGRGILSKSYEQRIYKEDNSWPGDQLLSYQRKLLNSHFYSSVLGTALHSLIVSYRRGRAQALCIDS